MSHIKCNRPRSTRQWYYLKVALILLLHNSLVFGQSTDITPICIGLSPENDIDQHVLIEQSGCFVLKQSFKQDWLYDFAQGGRRGPASSDMIISWAKNTELDLLGYSISSNTGINGITANPDRGGGNALNFGSGELHRLLVRNGTITLHNGRFEESGSSGAGVVSPKYAQGTHLRRDTMGSRQFQSKKVDYFLENLTIKTIAPAALLMGDGIVIRNCTIEVEGENALVIYGANAVIENNRIVYRHRASERSKAPDQADTARANDFRSAVYLRAADNAVVRGNTITVEGGDTLVSAVSVIDSKNVLVSGNRFNRSKAPVAFRGPSTILLRGNTVKEGRFGQERSMPDVDLQ